ncbi:helix-turn-helix transcriptional regulator [Methanobrevibacter sp.]|uniref:helix-turn-helix transcriptional regulator n=1 Tax=Methanobrevibacter sp. TaxID=66852 RepID=UPI00386E5FFE
MYTCNEINDNLKFLAQSEIRLKILSELYEKPENIRGLVKKTKINYSSVSSNVSKLEENEFIHKIEKEYYLNPMSKIYFETLMDFKRSIDIIIDYGAFWNQHNINQLSIDSMENIIDLKDSKLIETTPLDIYKTHNTTKNQLIESKNVKAIFPYLHPEYPDLIETILKNGGSVELVIPRVLFKAIMSPINDLVKKDAIKQGRLIVYTVTNELNLYLTICDDKMSLGLFKNDGSFDQNRILVSDDEKSHEWAEKLFKHVKHMVIK